ncbi:hypothetical protein DM860_008917 [Cuscuta australis]|uniref:Uncharacterized protein n=1 Tax=Cuscuta australis TaxID=267555 RepID=A0A328D7R2_9ASTE|nr:hypothetical protein DM860_008917 [Cuscuta australis]
MEDEERDAWRKMITPSHEKTTEEQSNPCLPHPATFSLKDVNACVLSSENTRLVCSITIALLAGTSQSNSIIASTPLCLLILTDVAIVAAWLLVPPLAAGRQQQEEKEEENGGWKGAFAMLEVGLVVYQVFRALFIDCSFYIVVLLCGLCLL